MPDLFSTAGLTEAPKDEIIAPGAMLLRGFALPFVEDILRALGVIAAQAPFRHMATQWGAVMSVAMTGRQWPDMPGCFRALARSAADRAGYPGFAPDACLINRYAPGTRLTPHQDRDERDYAHPIVSVSLGLSASFQFGGAKRRDPMRKLPLRHGDVVVWGNESRLAYHGIAELKDGRHPLLGALRINLTFRRAL
jgi:alkylated DNA repair protein (DNA oxidative demethylase)